MKKHIPNLITLLNLAAGTLTIYMVLFGHIRWAMILISSALILDFLDGTAARVLNASSETGKQLDSLADIVSFGLVPAAMIFVILKSIAVDDSMIPFSGINWLYKAAILSVLVVPVFTAIRLARFNIQLDSNVFFGLPAPANAIFWTGIYYGFAMNHSLFDRDLSLLFVWSLMIIMTVFLVVPLPMLTLKFNSFSMKRYFLQYLLIVFSVLILFLTGFSGLPIVILIYIFLSLIRILLT